METEEQLSQRFQCKRNGNHVMGTPFESDLYHYRNLDRRDPCPLLSKDAYISCVFGGQ